MKLQPSYIAAHAGPSRSVLECGDWRGTGLAPLSHQSSARKNPAPLKAPFALTPHPPQSRIWRRFAALLAFLAITICVRAQIYSIAWYKIAGGGGTSTNGQYSLSGTIGQHDAGGAMAGGNYSLTGGFWSLIAVVQTPGAPLLTITYAGNQAVVSWPLPSTGWTLQTNSQVGTTPWGNYTGPVVNNSVTNAPPKGNLFFRLTHP